MNAEIRYDLAKAMRLMKQCRDAMAAYVRAQRELAAFIGERPEYVLRDMCGASGLNAVDPLPLRVLPLKTGGEL